MTTTGNGISFERTARCLGSGSAPVQATQVSTDHLELDGIRAMRPFRLERGSTLALEIMPKRGMHVYAPCEELSRHLAEHRPTATCANACRCDTRRPRLHFTPLNERVPVFQKPFTLLMDVVPEATAEARKAFAGRNELVISGTLKYQACDDKLCYNLVSLPLHGRWRYRASCPARPSRRSGNQGGRHHQN